MNPHLRNTLAAVVVFLALTMLVNPLLSKVNLPVVNDLNKSLSNSRANVLPNTAVFALTVLAASYLAAWGASKNWW